MSLINFIKDVFGHWMDYFSPASPSPTSLHRDDIIITTMSGQPPPPLTQGAGYGVIVGLGVAFAIGM